jgi:hypothetical protein
MNDIKGMKKFLVLMHHDSVTSKMFPKPDLHCAGHPTLTCETIELLGGQHTRIKRIPTEDGSGGKSISHQNWWIATADIAAVFEYDGDIKTIGF